MWLVLIGLLLLVLKLGGYITVSDSDVVAWTVVLAPFGLAVLWWAWSDASGYTQRRVMDAIEAKKAARRQQSLDALGMGDKNRRR
jgi:small Trp-rich protein